MIEALHHVFIVLYQSMHTEQSDQFMHTGALRTGSTYFELKFFSLSQYISAHECARDL